MYAIRSYYANLGNVILSFDGSKNLISKQSKLFTYNNIKDVTPLATVTDKINQINADVTAAYSKKISTSAILLSSVV